MDVVTTLGESECAVQLLHAAKSWWPRAWNSLSSHDCTCLTFVPEPKHEVSYDSVGRKKGLLNPFISTVIQGAFVYPSTCSSTSVGSPEGPSCCFATALGVKSLSDTSRSGRECPSTTCFSCSGPGHPQLYSPTKTGQLPNTLLELRKQCCEHRFESMRPHFLREEYGDLQPELWGLQFRDMICHGEIHLGVKGLHPLCCWSLERWCASV